MGKNETTAKSVKFKYMIIFSTHTPVFFQSQAILISNLGTLSPRLQGYHGYVRRWLG